MLSTDFGITFPQSVLDSIKILKKATLKLYFSENRSGDMYIYSLSDPGYSRIMSRNPGVSSQWHAIDTTNVIAMWLNNRGTGTEHRFRVYGSLYDDSNEGFVKIEGSHETLYARIELEYMPHNYTPDAPTSLSPDSLSTAILSDDFTFYYSDYDGDAMSKCRFRYRILGNQEWITTDEIQVSTLSNTYVTYSFPAGTFLNGTTYEWQAASFDGALWSDWSQTAVFVTNSPPSKPSELNPNTVTETLNAAVSNGFSFVYSDPDEHTMKQYRIRYMLQGETEWTMMPAIPKSLESGTSCICTVSSNTFEAGRSYIWQASVYDGFLWSEWSDSAAFKTNTQPDKPTVLNPDTDMSTVDPSVPFNLSFLYSDADSHDMSKCQVRFRVLHTGTWTECPVSSIPYPNNSMVTYELPSNTLERDDIYEWQARVFDGQAWSLWSDSAILKTDPVQLPPRAPVLITPTGTAKGIDVKHGAGFCFSYDPQGAVQYQIRYRVQEGDWTTTDPIDNVRPNERLVTYMIGAYTFDPDCIYEWQARVYNGNTWSDWSSAAEFVTTDVTTAGTAKYVAIRAADVSGTVNKSYIVTYDPSIYRLSDVCAFAGHPSDHGINVIQVDETSGTIRFSTIKEVASSEMWTGIVNILKFLTLVDNNTIITVVEE